MIPAAAESFRKRQEPEDEERECEDRNSGIHSPFVFEFER